MNCNYAQVNEAGYCTGISSLSGDVIQENMILLEAYDESYLGRKYDRVNNEWTDDFFCPSVDEVVESVTLDSLNVGVEEVKVIASSTEDTVLVTADDALLLMENQLAIDEKLDLILEHLGL